LSLQPVARSPVLTRIAIREKLDGKVVDGMEKVSDEPYQS
jgi:hypothetical protein